MSKEIKCIHCGEWSSGEQEFCTNFGKMMNEIYLKEKEELSKAEGMKLPLIEIPEGDNFILKGFKYIFRFGQLIFFAIISLIAAISASTVH